MISRKIEERIKNFLTHDNRALLVEGARQTGKTYSIRRVGKECFEHFLEINFYEQSEAVSLFHDAMNARELLLRLSSLSSVPLVPGKTLIFFDEVQACREIVTLIKFLVDEGSFRYVMSGSLLGVELKDLRSVPVGYLSIMDMYPLDLEEFATAIGIGPQVIDHLYASLKAMTPVDDFVHKRMLDMVRLYLIIGGMPAVVQRYIETNNLQEVSALQRDIIRLYRKDISQYDQQSKLRIAEVFDLIPSELNAKNKRFILKSLNEKSRFSYYEDSFVWLKEAGVAIPAYNVEEPSLPLLLNKQRNLFKLFLNDVGLLACMYAGGYQIQLLQNNLTINYGSVFENLVAQEFYAHGYAGFDHSLYYFNSKKQGELDFVIESEGHVIPVEVKSGKDYHRHNALSNVLSIPAYDIQEAYVLCQDNLSRDGKISYLPIYMLMFLKPAKLKEPVYSFDLTGLR